MEIPHGIIAGMDEAGRGSWAGPVVAAAVIFPKPRLQFPGLTDSKLLTEAKRESLYEKIIKKCKVGVGIIPHSIVDNHGLMRATHSAFTAALEALNQKPDHLLIDGRDRFRFSVPHTSIIKGDQKIRVISAASIIAKVTRDRLMLEFGSRYPQYGFEAHKGYGTKRHQSALKRHGPSPIHRLSYQPLIQLRCK